MEIGTIGGSKYVMGTVIKEWSDAEQTCKGAGGEARVEVRLR